MRVAPGVAALHSLYAIYHLARKASGRTPASSASYMLFACFFDVAVIAFYVLGGYISYKEWDPKGIEQHDPEDAWTTWSTILHDAAPKTDIAGIFTMCVTLAFCITGFFHLLSLGLSIWLFQMFRAIVRLPPDMNPLEDNLTRRLKHKHNKSSITSESTWGFEDDDRKSTRFLQSQNTNRRSDGAYEDFSRPPSIPFMHTRTGSSTTLASHSSIPVGTSPRGSNIDLPPRNYQIPYAGSANTSQRNSMVSLGNGSQSPPKRGSYAAVPQRGEQSWIANHSPQRDARREQARRSMPNIAGKSTRAAPLNGDTVIRRPKSNYGSRYGRYDSGNDSDGDVGNSVVSKITDPLSSHPVEQQARPPQSPQRIPAPQRESALSQMTLNRMNTVATHSSSIYSTDEMGNPPQGDLSALDRRSELTELTPSPKKNGGRSYGELRNSGMGEVPMLVGRNVSTGNDLGMQKGYRREVSGAVAEEGRGGQEWGARFRKVSALGQAQ